MFNFTKKKAPGLNESSGNETPHHGPDNQYGDVDVPGLGGPAPGQTDDPAAPAGQSEPREHVGGPPPRR